MPLLKKPQILNVFILSLVHLLTQSDVALAQLRLGRGIQPGLEGHLLEYQIQQQPLERIRSIDSCNVGLGVGCNKTASLIQEIVTKSSGKTYQDLILQATGGRDNYLRFQSYYPQNINLERMPLNSFWLDRNNYILDSYQYSGIGKLDRLPRSDLRQIVNNFNYAPVTAYRQKINLQQGLIGLKTAYGKTLLEEARKIPDLKQQIAAADLSKAEINFHLRQFLNSVEAAENSDEAELNQSLYELLSNPYVSEPSTFNRPALGISGDVDGNLGLGLEADEYISAILTGEATETALISSPEVVNDIPSNSNTPYYVMAGVGGLTLLILLLTNLGGSDGSALANDNPNGNEQPGDNPPPDDGGMDNPDIFFAPTIIVEEPSVPPSPDVLSIPESTSTMQFVILIILALFILKRKKLIRKT